MHHSGIQILHLAGDFIAFFYVSRKCSMEKFHRSSCLYVTWSHLSLSNIGETLSTLSYLQASITLHSSMRSWQVCIRRENIGAQTTKFPIKVVTWKVILTICLWPLLQGNYMVEVSGGGIQ